MVHYIFIINGRKDFAHVLPDVQAQLAALPEPISADLYVTQGPGDGTRYVRLYCEFHESEQTCFVACGGSGTTNEVAAGLMGSKPGKWMAILAYGTTNDLTKYYPGRNFKSIRDLLAGETVSIDIIRCNDDYAVNVVNFGFDSMVAYYANENIAQGKPNGYIRGVIRSMLLHRFNRFTVRADGEKISRGLTLLCAAGNARYCGGEFCCTPKALIDDGLMDVCLIHSISLLSFLCILPLYKAGRHPESAFCRHRMAFRRVRKIEVESKYLMYMSLDGEIVAATHFELEILDKALKLQLPILPEEASATPEQVRASGDAPIPMP